MNLSKVEELYTNSLREHGTSPQAVGWRDEGSQLLRFDKLIYVMRHGSARVPVTVADLGCGYGAFYDYMKEHDYELTEFIGYDISDEMLTEARCRVKASEVTFQKGSMIDKEVDYAFTSGIFNVRFGNSEDDWWNYIVSILDNMNKMSKKGFAFNLLTSYVDWREKHLYYGDPSKFFNHCKNNYSDRVSLIHDYPLWEWTICVNK